MLRASNFRGNFIGLIAQKKMVQVRKLTCNAGVEVEGRCGNHYTFGFGVDVALLGHCFVLLASSSLCE